MKKFLTILCALNISLFATVITGNQGKVSVTGGSISVTGNDGVTQTVNSGEISHMNEQGASKARKIRKGDLDDIYDDLKANDATEKINLKYELVEYKIARKIKADLIKKKIPRTAIGLKQFNRGTQLFVRAIDLRLIQKTYPPYYKAAKKFFKKQSNKKKVPTLTIKRAHMKKYHRRAFR